MRALDPRAGSTQIAQPQAWSERRPRISISERRLLLGVVDLVIVNLVLAFVMSRRMPEASLWTIPGQHPGWFIVLSVVWLTIASLFDAYNLRQAAHPGAGMAMGASAALVSALVYLLIPYITPTLPGSRSIILVFVWLMVGLVSIWRAIYALVLIRALQRKKVLIVGAGWSGQVIARAIPEYAGWEYEIVGFVAESHDGPADPPAGGPVLGIHRDLLRLAREHGVSEIVMANNPLNGVDPELLQAVIACREQGLEVSEMPALYERLTRRVPIEHAGSNLHVVLPLTDYPVRLQWMIKRAMDTVIALAGLPVLAILIPMVALAQRLESPGPLFYGQSRVGRHGQIFHLLKFRTMIPDAETNGAQWAQKEDRRVTRMGRWLRRLHLDEIPQAINVLRGELSFIGPRPERPAFVAELEQQIPYYRVRHAVRPGITGWAQVNYPYAASVEDALVKLEYDLYYIKHQSVWLDFRILFNTISHVLRMRGR
jgi:exopolysaccharide biosynthesis polyprenyl glycosylphosphotransferase